MLTDEQRALAEKNIGLTYHMAEKYINNTPFDRDELISMFSEALVRSAQYFDPTQNTKFSSYACRAMEHQLSREWDSIKRQTLRALSFDEIIRDPSERMSWERFVGSGELPIDTQIVNKIAIEEVIKAYKGSPGETKAVIEFAKDPEASQRIIAEHVGVSQKLVSTAIAKLRAQLQAEMTG